MTAIAEKGKAMQETGARLLIGLLVMSLLPAVTTGAAEPKAEGKSKLGRDSLKYGLYIHFGIATFAGAGEKGGIPAERFAPTALDVRGWVRSAKEAGMTFAVLTAKHESGFCLWDSKDYGYDIAGSPFKRDIIAEFVAACKAEGIVPGVHYSIPDAYNEGAAHYKGAVPPPYFNVIKQHITELHSKYPDLRIQILDMSGRLSPTQFDELRQIVGRLNPQCAVWGTTGGDQGPHHVAATVIRRWMWSPNPRLNPAQQLFDRYQQCQAIEKAFVLNVAPDTTGRIPDDQVAVLTEMKKLIASGPAKSAQPAATNGKASAAERLKQVKELYEKGLISKEDYDKKVKEILDSL
jgi:alpha-L-fucosidase